MDADQNVNLLLGDSASSNLKAKTPCTKKRLEHRPSFRTGAETQKPEPQATRTVRVEGLGFTFFCQDILPSGRGGGRGLETMLLFLSS